MQIPPIAEISEGCDNIVLMFDLTCGYQIILIAVFHVNYDSCSCANCRTAVAFIVKDAIAVLYTQVMMLFQSCFKV